MPWVVVLIRQLLGWIVKLILDSGTKETNGISTRSKVPVVVASRQLIMSSQIRIRKGRMRHAVFRIEYEGTTSGGLAFVADGARYDWRSDRLVPRGFAGVPI